MKKVALFGFLLALLFATTTFAAYPLSVSTTESAIVATMTGAQGSTSEFQILVSVTEFPVGEYKAVSTSANTVWPGATKKTPETNGSITWSVGVDPNTTYYVRVVEIPKVIPPAKGKPSFYTTDSKTVATKPATITPGTLIVDSSAGNGSALITGTIDVKKNPHYQRYNIELQYSQEPLAAFKNTPKDNENYPTRYSIYPGHKALTSTLTTPNEKGEYHLFIPSNLTPSARYNLREIITYGGTQKITDGSFVVGGAYTPSTATGAIQADFENRSYRLLAPFPGLSILFDPDLCQEQAALGKPVFGGSCDDQVSAFINLGLKILIGAACVLLVLRIMFEGYKYITTDIPRLKVNAKSGLWDAVLGLVLALSSFLILNTINPKLLENTVNIDRLEIGVEIIGDGTSNFAYGTKTRGLSSKVYCPGSGGKTELSKIATSFTGNVVYSQSARNTVRSDGKQSLDCSSYVAQVLNCAGYTIPGVAKGFVNTSSIFSKSEAIRGGFTKNGKELVVNGKQLAVGDLLGWRKNGTGHVVMYLGNGRIIDVHGPNGSEANAQQWDSIDYYQNKYGFQYVYRVN